MNNLNNTTAMKAITILTMAIGLCSAQAWSQDLRYTQYNAIPTSINPAFAGSMDDARLATVYRNQWASMPGSYTGWHVAADWYNSNLNSGFGILMTQEEAGAGGLSTTRIAGQFAYEIPLGGGWRLRPALQGAFGNRSIDMQQLTFGDQLIRGPQVSTIEDRPSVSRHYFDFATGFLLSGKYNWLGVSFDHLNNPNESLNPTYIDPMDIKTSIHGGWRMPIQDYMRDRHHGDLIVAFNYMAQGPFDQLDLGIYYDTKPLSFGLWYQGLPFGHTIEGGTDVDAVSAIFGYGTENWKIGYSYDITLNRLGLSTTGGSHEIVLSYNWKTYQKKPSATPRYLPCPVF
ncbi:MAG: PorP/SprF family type IX secretion system membrane protein [Bacteroidetes bacterium]|nr:PorP/SprF family type IX secretion system membrane protein [Bacteroidota bacterium]